MVMTVEWMCPQAPKTEEYSMKFSLHKLFYAIAGLLVVGFAVRLWADFLQYDAMVHSAPFSTYVLVRAVEFLLPGAICFIAAMVLQKKRSK